MLKTKLTDTLMLEVSSSDALAICRSVVADLGWRVMDQSPMNIRCKEVAVSAMSFNWPAEVDVVLSSPNASQTTVLLSGSVFGFGPIQKGHLQGQLGNLRNRIELIAQERSTRAPAAASVPLSVELEKLAALRKDGILTEDEFQKAKQRLLDGTK
jgi:hypothetical protein